MDKASPRARDYLHRVGGAEKSRSACREYDSLLAAAIVVAIVTVKLHRDTLSLLCETLVPTRTRVVTSRESEHVVSRECREKYRASGSVVCYTREYRLLTVLLYLETPLPFPRRRIRTRRRTAMTATQRSVSRFIFLFITLASRD